MSMIRMLLLWGLMIGFIMCQTESNQTSFGNATSNLTEANSSIENSTSSQDNKSNGTEEVTQVNISNISITNQSSGEQGTTISNSSAELTGNWTANATCETVIETMKSLRIIINRRAGENSASVAPFVSALENVKELMDQLAEIEARLNSSQNLRFIEMRKKHKEKKLQMLNLIEVEFAQELDETHALAFSRQRRRLARRVHEVLRAAREAVRAKGGVGERLAAIQAVRDSCDQMAEQLQRKANATEEHLTNLTGIYTELKEKANKCGFSNFSFEADEIPLSNNSIANVLRNDTDSQTINNTTNGNESLVGGPSSTVSGMSEAGASWESLLERLSTEVIDENGEKNATGTIWDMEHLLCFSLDDSPTFTPAVYFPLRSDFLAWTLNSGMVMIKAKLSTIVTPNGVSLNDKEAFYLEDLHLPADAIISFDIVVPSNWSMGKVEIARIGNLHSIYMIREGDSFVFAVDNSLETDFAGFVTDQTMEPIAFRIQFRLDGLLRARLTVSASRALRAEMNPRQTIPFAVNMSAKETDLHRPFEFLSHVRFRNRISSVRLGPLTSEALLYRNLLVGQLPEETTPLAFHACKGFIFDHLALLTAERNCSIDLDAYETDETAPASCSEEQVGSFGALRFCNFTHARFRYPTPDQPDNCQFVGRQIDAYHSRRLWRSWVSKSLLNVTKVDKSDLLTVLRKASGHLLPVDADLNLLFSLLRGQTAHFTLPVLGAKLLNGTTVVTIDVEFNLAELDAGQIQLKFFWVQASLRRDFDAIRSSLLVRRFVDQATGGHRTLAQTKERDAIIFDSSRHLRIIAALSNTDSGRFSIYYNISDTHGIHHSLSEAPLENMTLVGEQRYFTGFEIESAGRILSTDVLSDFPVAMVRDLSVSFAS